jgi:hypothetical protein
VGVHLRRNYGGNLGQGALPLQKSVREEADNERGVEVRRIKATPMR